MTKLLLLVCVLAGCEKNLLAGMDAGPDAPGAMPDAPSTCPAVAVTPLPPGHFKYFINTEGVTLTKCSVDDARTNCSTLVPADTTFPPFLPGDPNRQPLIDAIVVRVQEKLAPYSIDVVTTRPASGDYYMSVFGGDPTLVNGPTGTFDITPTPCNFDNRDLVTLEFDRGRAPGYTDYANSAISDLALLVGLAPDSVDGDCLCRTGNCNSLTTQICTFGTNVTVDSTHSCGRTTQDEPMLLTSALGCR